MTTSSLVRRRCDEIARRAQRASDVAGVFEAASSRLRQLVPFDTAMWWPTDPATGLPAAPPRLDGLVDNRDCRGYWDHEFLADDVIPFRGLARADLPVGTLRAATSDRPTRSSRYRQFLQPTFSDELRAVLRVDGTTWGAVCLLRAAGRPAFSERDVSVLAELSRPLAAALRACMLRGPRRRDGDETGAGLLLFGPDGELASVNDAAHHWIAELSVAAPPAPASPLGIGLPSWLASLVFQARGLAEGLSPEAADPPQAWARVRSHGDTWLTCRASCLRDESGRVASTALVIEPARAGEVAPILVEAYGLTDREKQVTGLIAQGASTAEIAGQLYLSTHTVRHHVKALFEKLQVSSRGELVAKLFAEHHFSAVGPPVSA